MPCGKKIDILLCVLKKIDRQSLRSGGVFYGYDFKGRRNTRF